MTEPQWVAIAWGSFAVVFGTVFIVFRRRIASEARQRHGSQQTPALFASGGAVIAVMGAAAIVAGATGIVG